MCDNIDFVSLVIISTAFWYKSFIITWTGARPTNDISIEFEIRSKLGTLLFQIYLTDHNEILHTSRQCHCRDVCKISLWSVKYILN